jgi:hypothetical protein
MMGLAASQTLEPLFLKDTQQFRLQSQRDVAYFVQKQRAFIGHLEAPNLLRDSSGKGASLMAKELAFEQIEGNGGAVELDKRASAAGANIRARCKTY